MNSADDLLVTFTVIFGSATLFPGVFPVTTGYPPRNFEVQPIWKQALIDEARKINLDVRDSTIFRVVHLDRKIPDVITPSISAQLLDDSLLAISECLLWFKKNNLGPSAPHSRQVGRIDVKFFSIPGEDASRVAWLAPGVRIPPAVQDVFPKIRMLNGPASNPTPAEVRRFMAAVDLWSLGFFTESFVSAFALLDDLAQEVLRAGLAGKGMEVRDIEELMRAIKERRLEMFLTSLTELAGWTSIKSANPVLLKAILKANTERNRIMHGSSRIDGHQSLAFLSTIQSAIAWLAQNPFGKVIPPLPPIQIVTPTFRIFEKPPGRRTQPS